MTFEEFVNEVAIMRQLQTDYFKCKDDPIRKRSLLICSKQSEKLIDEALKNDFGLPIIKFYKRS